MHQGVGRPGRNQTPGFHFHSHLCLTCSALNFTYPSFIKTLEKRQDKTLRGVTEKM